MLLLTQQTPTAPAATDQRIVVRADGTGGAVLTTTLDAAGQTQVATLHVDAGCRALLRLEDVLGWRGTEYAPGDRTLVLAGLVGALSLTCWRA